MPSAKDAAKVAAGVMLTMIVFETIAAAGYWDWRTIPDTLAGFLRPAKTTAPAPTVAA